MLIAVIMAAAAVLVSTGSASSEVVANSVGGGAFGEQVRGPVSSGPIPSVVVPPSGGTNSASLAEITVPKALSAGLLKVSASSGNVGTASGFAKSEASVLKVKVGTDLLPPTVIADAVSSKCRADAGGVSGSSELINLKVKVGSLFKTQAKVPMPNTVVDVPGVARIILNEQIKSGNGIIVNAVHVKLLGILPGELETDIIIAQSRCSTENVNVSTTSSSTVDSSSTSSSTTTTAPPSGTCSGGSVFDTTKPPAATTFADTAELELGVHLTVDVTVKICAVVFFKAEGATGIHGVKLWDAVTKTVIGSGSVVVDSAAAAWITVKLDAQVTVNADAQIVASYHTPGPFVKTSDYDWSADEGALNATAGGYRYGATQFPDEGGASSNFWVSVIFNI